jgi:hypothetical protein
VHVTIAADLSKKPIGFPDPKAFNLADTDMADTDILNWVDKKQ